MKRVYGRVRSDGGPPQADTPASRSASSVMALGVSSQLRAPDAFRSRSDAASQPGTSAYSIAALLGDEDEDSHDSEDALSWMPRSERRIAHVSSALPSQERRGVAASHTLMHAGASAALQDEVDFLLEGLACAFSAPAACDASLSSLLTMCATAEGRRALAGTHTHAHTQLMATAKEWTRWVHDSTAAAPRYLHLLSLLVLFCELDALRSCGCAVASECVCECVCTLACTVAALAGAAHVPAALPADEFSRDVASALSAITARVLDRASPSAVGAMKPSVHTHTQAQVHAAKRTHVDVAEESRIAALATRARHGSSPPSPVEIAFSVLHRLLAGAASDIEESTAVAPLAALRRLNSMKHSVVQYADGAFLHALSVYTSVSSDVVCRALLIDDAWKSGSTAATHRLGLVLGVLESLTSNYLPAADALAAIHVPARVASGSSHVSMIQPIVAVAAACEPPLFTTGAAEHVLAVLEPCLRCLANVTNHQETMCEQAAASILSDSSASITGVQGLQRLLVRLLQRPPSAKHIASKIGHASHDSLYDALVGTLGVLLNLTEHSSMARQAFVGTEEPAGAAVPDTSVFRLVCNELPRRALLGVPALRHPIAPGSATDGPPPDDAADDEVQPLQVVVASYLALLVCCNLIGLNEARQVEVLRVLKEELVQVGGATAKWHPAGFLLAVLRAFQALQERAGIFTEDQRAHMELMYSMLQPLCAVPSMADASSSASSTKIGPSMSPARRSIALAVTTKNGPSSPPASPVSRYNPLASPPESPALAPELADAEEAHTSRKRAREASVTAAVLSPATSAAPWSSVHSTGTGSSSARSYGRHSVESTKADVAFFLTHSPSREAAPRARAAVED